MFSTPVFTSQSQASSSPNSQSQQSLTSSSQSEAKSTQNASKSHKTEVKELSIQEKFDKFKSEGNELVKQVGFL